MIEFCVGYLIGMFVSIAVEFIIFMLGMDGDDYDMEEKERKKK